MKRVVIESPYKGRNLLERWRNKIYLNRCIKDSLDRGESPYASHAILTRVLCESNNKERMHGIMAGYAWLPSAHIQAFYLDYGFSHGMVIAEHKRNCYYPEIEFEKRNIGPNKDIVSRIINLIV